MSRHLPAAERRELGMLLLLALVARLVAWHFVDGFVWPDEYFQSLEPAHQVLFGHGLLAWEWEEGIRSWAVPYAYVALFRLAALVGLDGPGELVQLAQLANIALSLLIVSGSWRLGRLVGRRAAIGAGVLAALFAPLLFFAPRTLLDGGAAALTCAAFARFAEGVREDRSDGDRGDRDRAFLVAGALLGVAYAFRFTAPVFFVGPAVFLWVHGHGRALGRLVLGFLGVAVGLGLLDWLTWGRPFHSLLAYFSFNVAEGSSAHYGVEPMGWYLEVLVRQGGMAWPLAFALAIAGWIRRGALGACGLGIGMGFLAMSVIAHKEERFLLPAVMMLPVGLALGAERIATTVTSARRWRVGVASAVLVLVMSSSWAAWLGRDWSPNGEWIAAMRWIGEREDVHGVIATTGWANLGGDVVHRKDLPLIADHALRDGLPASLVGCPLFDTIVAEDQRVHGFEEVARFGRVVVLRRR